MVPMGDNESTHARRAVLQSVVTSVTGLSLMASSPLATGESNHNAINTEFNPKREQEVINFIKHINEKGGDAQEAILDDLNRAQRNAIAKAMKPRAANGEKKEYAVATSNLYDYYDAYQFNLYGLGGVKVFELHHEIMWNVEDGEVTEADATGWTENVGAFWADGGNIKSRLIPADNSSADVRSIRGRKLNYATGPWNTFTYRPETTLFADGTPVRSGVSACDDGGVGGMENVDGALVCPSDYQD